MTDEKYLFLQDVREKKNTGRSARNKRTHCGKGGSVKLPSDYLSKKELQKMNGDVISYKLNSPMSWDEFKAMPDDIRTMYIKNIRTQFGAPGTEIAKMMGCAQRTISSEIIRLGLGEGRGVCKAAWDKEGFYAWKNGVAIAPVKADLTDKTADAPEQPLVSVREINEPEPVAIHTPEIKVLPVHAETQKSVPFSGDLCFEGSAEAALKTVAAILGGANVRISITWEACPTEGGEA